MGLSVPSRSRPGAARCGLGCATLALTTFAAVAVQRAAGPNAAMAVAGTYLEQAPS